MYVLMLYVVAEHVHSSLGLIGMCTARGGGFHRAGDRVKPGDAGSLTLQSGLSGL